MHLHERNIVCKLYEVVGLVYNIWIERFWRSIKQEYIYITPADSVDELRYGISQYITYYNAKRPHQSLNGLLPAMYYGKVA